MLMGMTHERDGLRRQLIEQLNSRDIPACFVFKLLLFFTRHCLWQLLFFTHQCPWQDYKDMWGFKSEELANTHIRETAVGPPSSSTPLLQLLLQLLLRSSEELANTHTHTYDTYVRAGCGTEREV